MHDEMTVVERARWLTRVRCVGGALAVAAIVCGALASGCRKTAPESAPPAASTGTTDAATPSHGNAAPPAGTSERASAGGQGLAGEASAPDANLRAAADRYDLGPDEQRGGHTLARHVGRTDEQLRERLRREPRIIAASTYTDRATAERVVARALAANRPQVDAWIGRQGDRPNLVIDYHSPAGDPIGRSIERGSRNALDCEDALIVLRWGGRSFYVLTTYPMAAL